MTTNSFANLQKRLKKYQERKIIAEVKRRIENIIIPALKEKS